MQKITFFAALFFLSVLASFSLLAQTEEDLSTDRPGAGSDAPDVVPHGSLQVEAGIDYEFDKADGAEFTNWALPTSLFRIGLFERAELRLELGIANEQVRLGNDDEVSTAGLGAISIGSKILIAEEKGLMPTLSFQGMLTIPGTGAEDFQVNYVVPSFRLLTTNNLSDKVSLTTNIGYDWNENGNEKSEATFVYAVSLDAMFTEKLGGFFEPYGFIPEIAPAEHYLNAGFIYLLAPNFQFDISYGLALTEDAPDYFVSAGLSWRTGLFRPKKSDGE